MSLLGWFLILPPLSQDGEHQGRNIAEVGRDRGSLAMEVGSERGKDLLTEAF